MEIVDHRRKMLDDMESNGKGNHNFATKLISMKNVEGKSSRNMWKKLEQKIKLISFPSSNLGQLI